MTDYMGGFTNIRRGPKFKPGDMVYESEKFIVESSEWNSISNETTYIIRNAWGTCFKKEESELMGVPAIPADRYRNDWRLQQRRLMLNSFYGAQSCKLMGIKKVIFNAPATIVLWNDGTKTVVKCSENDIFDPEKGLAFCFLKKLLGNGYYKIIDSEMRKYDEQKLADVESDSIVGQALKSIADDIKTGLTALGLSGGANS